MNSFATIGGLLLIISSSLALVSCQLGQIGPNEEYNQEDGDFLTGSSGRLVDSLLDRWFQHNRGANNDIDSSDEDEDSIEKRRDDSPYYFYDVNAHLPANDPGDLSFSSSDSQNDNSAQLRGPVNEPQEWEAKMGQLTDELNHRLPVDSPVRQALLMSLINNNSSTALDSSSLNDYLLLELQSAEDWQQQPQQTNQDNDDDTEPTESHGSEYIAEPLVLFGHQLVQGGAGEGRQLLGPDGTFENVQVVKTDSAIPSYCDPPNPCPLGYSSRDGCLEQFVNSASFSREYQAKQKCSCDNEHSLFNCASPQLPGNGVADATKGPEVRADELLADSSKLDALARTISNRFGDLASVRKLIDDQQARDSQPLEYNSSSSYTRTARKWSPELNGAKLD